MSFLGILLQSFAIGFSGAMMPGPLLTVNIAETARRGFFASVLLMIGHSILELAIVVALLFGLQRVITSDYRIAMAVSLLGGAFLLWMAYGMISGLVKGQLSLNLETKEKPRPGMHPIGAGILVSASNPYWFLWWVILGSSLLLQSQARGAGGIVAFYIGHISSDFVWYCFVGAIVALGVSAGRQLKAMNNIYRGVLLICAAFLILVGVRFLNTGAQIARTHEIPMMKPAKRAMAPARRQPASSLALPAPGRNRA